MQIDRILDEASLVKLRHGVKDNDEWLKADAVELLRTGEKQSWLAFTLSEGRNRQIRRMVASVDAEVPAIDPCANWATQVRRIAQG